MSPDQPPQWTTDELERERARAIDVFRTTRLEEPLEDYVRTFDEAHVLFSTLLRETDDLRDMRSAMPRLLEHDPRLLEVLRYVAGPPVSADDLRELAAVRSLACSRLVTRSGDLDEVVGVIERMLDARRFPWRLLGRCPTDAERETAVTASAAMLAMRRTETARRSSAKRTQEAAVAECLRSCGFVEVPRRPIDGIADAPAAGEFCGETMFGSRQADLVVGLHDGRKAPIECKVSNSEVNSFKRLNNDAAQKAVVWLREFGERVCVPVAVLTGVFKVDNLAAAQRHGLTLFWEHDLDRFAHWVSPPVR